MGTFKLTSLERSALYDLWVKEGKSNKTAIGKKYGISARTVGRIIEELEKKPVQVGVSQSVSINPVKNVANVVCTTAQIMVTFTDGTSSSVSRTNNNFNECFDLVRDNKLKELVEQIDLVTRIKRFTFGTDIEIIGGMLYYNGEVFDNRLSTRIIKECEAGSLEVNKYINFLRKLVKNPSFKAVQAVYEFIEHTDLTILDDGNIRAYKRLRLDGDVPVDIHTGKVENWKGWTIQMPRYLVEDNPTKTCSQGLHVAAQHYFQFFTCNNSTDVEVSVSPEHVVSVPVDYENAKCRVCEYTLLTGVEHPEGLVKTVIIGKAGKVL